MYTLSPVGIQSFKELRENGSIYIDKTALMYRLIKSYKYVFLGRPRRFGKSLLMSTIEYYYKGRKDLFKGLAIESLTDDWTEYPVLHFDLNTGEYEKGAKEVERVLNYQLLSYEKVYGGIDDTLSNRFLNLIRNAKEKTKKNVVILIDEYDKPILKTLNTKVEIGIREVLKSFYGCLKSADDDIKFAMLTGVTKFGKLSVFSDLNNLKDISLLSDYATICGITQEEILENLEELLSQFANKREVSKTEMLDILRDYYDGYRFSILPIKVFNPYSLFNALFDQVLEEELDSYWFDSGTPSFLVKVLHQNNFDLTKIDGARLRKSSLYKRDELSVLPILFQSGYLTLKDYLKDQNLWVLGYPNKEVEKSFLEFLLPYYSNVTETDASDELEQLVIELKNGEVNAFMTNIQSIFKAIPYAQDNSMQIQEDQFRNLMYIIFRFIGVKIQVESHTNRGRTDAIVFTSDYIYIMEFKINSTPEKALEQIHEKCYYGPYQSDTRKIILLGINYSTTLREITGWKPEPEEYATQSEENL